MSGKLVWVDALEDSWDKAKEKVTSALETGAGAVVTGSDMIDKVRELGRIKVVAPGDHADIVLVGIGLEGDGTLPMPEDVERSKELAMAKGLKAKGLAVAAYVRLEGKMYERLAAVLGKYCDYLVIEGKDWKVIPLENLIAELQGINVKIIAKAHNMDEASVALQTLEKGADGILIDTDNIAVIRDIAHAVSSKGMQVELQPATITVVKDVGVGDRVCIDTCSLMKPGEGMLIGNRSGGLFLVQSEAEESPYVASRPFRVNAGAVHEYVLTGDKTRYLSEMSGGDPALIVDKAGNAWKATVGRVKIERRPLLYVEAEVNGKKLSAILQNAETIKLVSDGGSIPVTRLKPGDKVLVRVEGHGRHFGMKIDETIIEK